MEHEIIGDMKYVSKYLLVWDIAPISPIKFTPWDLNLYQAAYRLTFQEPGYKSETASRVVVF
jgi:hypothetical protein